MTVNENPSPDIDELTDLASCNPSRLLEVTAERDELLELLSRILATEVGKDTFQELREGGVADTDDGKLWMAARSAVSRLQAANSFLNDTDCGIENSTQSAEVAVLASAWKTQGWRKLFHEAISSMLKVAPPLEMAEAYLDGSDVDELQQFCIDNMRLEWSMGISVIDAAHMFVEGAFENANIDAEGNLWPIPYVNSLSSSFR